MDIATMTDSQIVAEYTRNDDAFRAAKRRKDFKVASAHKAKRDALDAACDAAIKRQNAAR